MDIGFDTIIYIVLGLVFVLAQVAKKKKKAALSQSASNEDVSDSDVKSPVSFLEQLLGIPEQKPVVSSSFDENQHPPEDLDPSFLESGPRESTVAPVNESSYNLKARSKSKPAGYQGERQAKKTGFNLRQAIIYKAVLERKNF